MTEDKKFEEALDELEKIVTRLESPDVPLEQSIQLFEDGMKLARLLEKKLDEAEKKIEMLIKEPDGSVDSVPFPSGDEENGDVPF